MEPPSATETPLTTSGVRPARAIFLLDLHELVPVLGDADSESLEQVLVVEDARFHHVVGDAVHVAVGRGFAPADRLILEKVPPLNAARLALGNERVGLLKAVESGVPPFVNVLPDVLHVHVDDLGRLLGGKLGDQILALADRRLRELDPGVGI